MILKSTLLALLATSVGFSVYAADSTSGETSTKIESQNKVEGDLDNEITNNRMRAESGSKSKYSMSVSSRYSGGTIKEPFDSNRANLLGGNARPAVRWANDISARYRLNKHTSINAGAGLTLVQPFHSVDKSPINAEGRKTYTSYEQKFEPTSPFVSISSFRKMGKWMVSGRVTSTFYTESRFTDGGYLADVYASATGLYSFSNGLQVGLNGGVGSSIMESGENGEEAYIALNPFAEYVLNDTFNLRTVMNFALFRYKTDLPNGDRYDNGLVRQSFGLGIAATRDIFLYPNIQITANDFYRDVEADKTTVGFSATINVF